jgi:hypothetical protein
MKGIMAKESSSADQGVPSFAYNPADRKFPALFELTRPLDDLAGMLFAAFAGQTLSVKEVFEGHHIGRPYVLENYKAVLKNLEAAGSIACSPPSTARPKRHGEPTMADAVRVEFPRRR